ACIRKTDGSPVIQLGEGAARLLSPDGLWALCRVPVPHSGLTLYPSGPGPKREIESGGRDLAPGRQVRWTPDGRRILQFGRAEDGATAAWILDLESDSWSWVPHSWPALPLGLAISPDGSRLIASYPDSTTEVVLLPDGSSRPGPVLQPLERVVTFDDEGGSVYVCGP